MSKSEELKQHYGIEMAKVLNEVAGLSTKIAEVDVSSILAMSDGVRDSMGPQNAGLAEAAARQVAWTEERDKLKTKYVELELELRAAIEVAGEEATKALSPTGVSASDRLAAHAASPEALISTMDSAFDSGDMEQALLMFKTGLDRDLEDVVAHGLDHGPDEWSEHYRDILEASNQPGLEPGDKFESIAGYYPVGDKYEILKQQASDINVLGRMA